MRSLLPAFLLLAGTGLCAHAADTPRISLDIDSGWRFRRADVKGAEQPAFDDAGWRKVDLPHTWNKYDGEDGGNNFYRGAAWYRRTLALPASFEGKSLFLRFSGACLVTDVYVNGQFAGEHKGGFAAFCFNVTRFLHPGQPNTLAVRVDNAYDRNVPPLSGDFTLFGGIYREVHLLALSPLAITPTDYASPGVFLVPQKITSQQADDVVRTELRCDADTEQTAVVSAVLKDEEGRTVWSAEQKQSVPAHGRAVSEQALSLKDPHLWNGAIDPYLYTLTVDVRQDGKALDEVSQQVGFRFYRTDPNEGLFLNGSHYGLHGVCRHQDHYNEGWATTRADRRKDVVIMKAMGVNGVRLAHYQHSQYFYSLCDRNGIIAWAEIPLINSLTQSAEFDANARQQLTELIKQSFNHPAILFWSLFNELNYRADQPSAWALIPKLNDLAHSLDPSRLTTAASDQAASHPINFITDVIALNRYFGWYGGHPSDWQGFLDGLHKQYPSRCWAISEYGAGASAYQHENDPKQPAPGGPWHPEEWEATVHEAAWQAIKSHPYLWGSFLWVMFDFASDGRNEGDTPGRNDKGLVTYDRKTEKDAYFWYKANWTKAPFVYITDRRFTSRPAGTADIKIYSNCAEVSLTLNGKSLGALKSDSHIFLWKNIPLAAGQNRVEAEAVQAGHTIQDECVWETTESKRQGS